MPNINIDDAYILGETGAQVDKVTGLYFKDESTSAAEKAFAQLNIGTAGSNRNLLDNPWFTVNQRGVTSGTITNAAVVGPDRWHLFQCSWSVANNAITLAWGGGGTAAGFLQRTGPEVGYALVGKKCTISAYVNGTLYAKTVEIKEPSYGAQDLLLGEGVNIRVITDALSGNRGVEVQFRTTSTTNITIGPVKMEVGEVSTLANDAPPDYRTELAKCQRYFFRWNSVGSAVPVGFGWGFQTTYARITIPTPVQMRTPLTSVSYSGGGWYLMGGAVLSVTNITYSYYTGCGVTINAYASVTQNNTYTLICNASGSYIDISADL